MRSSESGVVALVLCAGNGKRSGLPYNKVLFPLGKKAALAYVSDAFVAAGVDEICLVIQPSDEQAIREAVREYEHIRIAYGGDTRAESVRRGLDAIPPCEIVVIHDGARPFVTPAIIERAVSSARAYGSGIAAVPAVDTVKQVRDGYIVGHPLRRELMCVQTPQAFRYDEIRRAYALAQGDETDDSEVYARIGKAAHIVESDYENGKITTPADLLRAAPARTRIGSGFDVHPLVPGRALILGGVHIPHEKGLLGHSDADVLVHAIMDALLGAAGLPDIGVLFPDTDPSYAGADSLCLLDEVMRRVEKCGYRVGNVSAVVMAQKPKLAPYIPPMRENLAARLHIDTDRIDISATTTEHLGIVGEEKGIAVGASCLLHETA